MMELLTNSRMSSAKTCLRKHYYEYELCIQKDRESQPLRIGSAVHDGLDLLATENSIDVVAHHIRALYAVLPAWIQTEDDTDDWYTECETVIGLLTGYQWYYSDSQDIRVIVSEQEFNIPLRNPDTGAPSTIWRLAGKIDKIVEYKGIPAIMEHKTTGEDLSPDSDYWKRLLIDQQISLYMITARELGHAVTTIVYDVIRKPLIRRLSIPVMDKDGKKIVLDKDGQRVLNKKGEPYQAGNAANGWTMQSRLQSPDEYRERLIADIMQRPEWYFARQEIPRLDADIQEFAVELWQQQKQLSDCKRMGRWFRNTNACLHPYRCEFFEICSNGIDPSVTLPDGYIQKACKHPELKGEQA